MNLCFSSSTEEYFSNKERILFLPILTICTNFKDGRKKTVFKRFSFFPSSSSSHGCKQDFLFLLFLKLSPFSLSFCNECSFLEYQTAFQFHTPSLLSPFQLGVNRYFLLFLLLLLLPLFVVQHLLKFFTPPASTTPVSASAWGKKYFWRTRFKKKPRQRNRYQSNMQYVCQRAAKRIVMLLGIVVLFAANYYPFPINTLSVFGSPSTDLFWQLRNLLFVSNYRKKETPRWVYSSSR